MNGFERRREQKKQAIKEAALTIFLESGTDNVTINQIADSAHVSHVSIYNFFGSKGRLINELALNIISEIENKYGELNEGSLSFEEKLTSIFNIKLDLIKNRKWEFVYTATRENDSLRSAYESMLSSSKDAFLRLINEGKTAGVIKPAIHNESILLLIDVFAFYFEQNESARAAMDMNHSVIHDLQSIFWYGLIR